MIVRPIEEKDKKEIIRWYVSRSWPHAAVEGIFPKIGLVAESKGLLLAVAWLYTTGTSMAFISWTATNPDVQEKLGMLALSEIIQGLQAACKELTPEIKVLEFYTKNEKLSQFFKKQGFRIKDEVKQLSLLVGDQGE